MKKTKLILCLLSLVLVLGSIFYFVKLKGQQRVLSGEVTISYSSSKGFVPDNVVVKVGTKVNFKNLSSKGVWPASDFYPSDTLYPDFNSQKEIQGGNSWSFTFNNLGSWSYHDDLNPINKGLIIVTDQDKYAANDISCNNLESLDYGGRQICWYNQIKTEIKKSGVSGALKLLSVLYNQQPLFAQGCHDATHLIGDAAYREFRKGKKINFTVETTYCGYGFYHGFIEAMLYTTGDYSEVTNFCETINSNLTGNVEAPNAIYSCYHGIGHSTFNSHDPQLWGNEAKMVTPAIKTCEKVTQGYGGEKTKQCVTGVFNALAIAYSTNLFNLKMNPKDPVSFCRTLTNSEYRNACFIEVSMAWINTTMGNFNYKFVDGVKFIERMGDVNGEKISLFGLVSDFVHLHSNELSTDDMVKNCNLVKPIFYESCIQGTELALLNWGKPSEEYKRALSFCDSRLLTSTGKNICYSYVFQHLPNLYSKEKRLEICNTEVSEGYKNQCLNSE